HLLVPQHGEVAALFRRQIGEGDTDRTGRADEIDLMAERIHVRDLALDIEPFGARVEARRVALAAPVGVAALLVRLGARPALALAQRLEHGPRPPMEV